MIFSFSSETEPEWNLDLQEDVLDECSRYGGVAHIYVDPVDPKVLSDRLVQRPVEPPLTS
jgi:hypothetical protein